MKKTCYFSLLLILICTSGFAEDEELTVKSQLDNCKAPIGQISRLGCFAYMKGYFDGFVTSHILDTGKHSACFGENMSIDQIVQMFVNWGETNPKDWNLPAATGVIAALNQNYHCSAKLK